MDASKVQQSPPRRFGLSDAMILVATIALGLAAIRWFDPEGEMWDILTSNLSNFAWRADDFSRVASGIMFLGIPLAIPMTLGVLTLRLRKPRPRWRRLVRQPGFVASLALILGWIVAGATTSVSVFWQSGDWDKTPTPEQLWWYWNHDFSNACGELAGFAIAVAWSTLLLVGRWRAEPSWVDRLGRVIGVAWVATALVAAYFGQDF